MIDTPPTIHRLPRSVIERVEQDRKRLERRYPKSPMIILLVNHPKGEPASLIVSSNMSDTGKRTILQEALDNLSQIIVPRH